MLPSVRSYILHWVELNLDSGKNIGDMISTTGYCRKTVETWFFREYGLSLGNYLFRRRMSRAAVLLRLTKLPITEIAELLHYSSSQNFARAYHRFTGKTPSEYRRSKNWDVSVLQYSFLYNMNIGDIDECALPERLLTGKTYHIQESFFYNPENESFNGLQKLIQKIFLNGDRDVFVSVKTINTPELSKSRTGIVNAEAVAGKLSEEKKVETVKIPGGDFCHCHFVGSWRDYYIYSFSFFIKLLADGKYIYTGGNHYIDFHHTINMDDDTISCDLFIPVNKA
ncbi:helix-turn-helix transcriptional regulator [Salmonella enterica]|nr:helix-turn-helix transcriptional regulator [Salmonella enterica]HAO0314534.1 helix-turn-helix transcriptional regulator [Escherichia coli]